MPGESAVVVFTRDLRVHDHPALVAAARRADRIVPLFVVDAAQLSAGHDSPNRVGFLVDALADLDGSLRARGAGLVVRRGDWVAEVAAVVAAAGAGSVHVSEDVSGYARCRLDRLERAVGAVGAVGAEVVRHPGITVVPPDQLAPAGGRAYQVFTPYHRRWRATPWRAVLRAPAALRLPPGIDRGRLPVLADLTAGSPSPAVVPGGE